MEEGEPKKKNKEKGTKKALSVCVVAWGFRVAISQVHRKTQETLGQTEGAAGRGAEGRGGDRNEGGAQDGCGGGVAVVMLRDA